MFQMQYPKADTSTENTERERRVPVQEPAQQEPPQHVVDEPSIPDLPIG